MKTSGRAEIFDYYNRIYHEIVKIYKHDLQDYWQWIIPKVTSIIYKITDSGLSITKTNQFSWIWLRTEIETTSLPLKMLLEVEGQELGSPTQVLDHLH